MLLEAGHGAHEGFWEGYFELLTSPAHIAFELTLILIFDVIIGMVVWPFIIKPRWQAAVRRHDKEVHGIDCEE